MTHFLLDTNICIELIRGRASRVFATMQKHRLDDVAISSITFAELQFGVAKSTRPAHNAIMLAQFCAPILILPFDTRAAMTYGAVRALLEQTGTPIGPMDTLIAAHALSRTLVLVTNNEREFRRVKGLTVENWLTS